jgi:hypothetical protein
MSPATMRRKICVVWKMNDVAESSERQSNETIRSSHTHTMFFAASVCSCEKIGATKTTQRTARNAEENSAIFPSTLSNTRPLRRNGM